MTEHEWAGDQPVFLLFQSDEDPVSSMKATGIDLDVEGWIEANRALFRKPGIWFLVEKESGRPRLATLIAEGDQFFYYRHHVGDLNAAREISIHTMGKKRPDGTVARLWLMPNDMVMTGEEAEVDLVAARMIG